MTLQAVKSNEPLMNKIGNRVSQMIENGEAKVMGYFDSPDGSSKIVNAGILGIVAIPTVAIAAREVICTYPGYVISGVAQNDDSIIGDMLQLPDGTSTMIYA